MLENAIRIIESALLRAEAQGEEKRGWLVRQAHDEADGPYFATIAPVGRVLRRQGEKVYPASGTTAQEALMKAFHSWEQR